jgi:two-component system, chemotaxis family, protein-glutamate methylesterase/glutaminase
MRKLDGLNMNLETIHSDHRRLKVLIADDSATVRQFLSVMISKLNNLEIVGFAVNGVEALEQIHRLKPDMVTLDIEMPGMNGLEVLETLQEEHCTPNVVVFSGSEQKEDQQRCLALGAKRFFNKSEEFANLIEFLRAAD